jgi:hypothetical protein
MEHLAEILHELIDAGKHALTPNRVGELHGLADKVDAAAREVAEAAGTVADTTAPEAEGGTPPA